jgi:hypothetical protein
MSGSRPGDAKMGYVYFITYDHEEWRKVLPFMKIGFTNNLDRRIKALSTGSPVPLILAGYIETNCPEELEEWIHGQLEPYGVRVNGEWFKVTSKAMELFYDLEKDIKENQIKELFSLSDEINPDEALYINMIKNQREHIRYLEDSNETMRKRLIEIDPLASKYITKKSIRPRGMETQYKLKPKRGW